MPFSAGGIVNSWGALALDGAIVSVAAPDILARAPAGRRGLWFVNKADATLVARLVAQLAESSLITKLSEAVGFDDIPAAIEVSVQSAHLDFCEKQRMLFST